MSDLAAALRVDPSTVTRTLQRMEAAGLARRGPAAADGRVVTVHLTDEGRRLHAAVAARRAAIIDGDPRRRSRPEDRDQLVDLLERFVASLDDYAAPSRTRPRPKPPGSVVRRGRPRDVRRRRRCSTRRSCTRRPCA